VIASKLRKKLVINAWLFIAVLLVAVIIPSLLYWTIERNDKHARWQTQLQLARIFAFYGMDQAEVVPMHPNFTSDSAFMDTGWAALQTGSVTLNTLSALDLDRTNQLLRIEYMLNTMASSWSAYTPGMNQSQRGTLGELLHTIGHDILYGYGNYINYTGTSNLGGSFFWYTGSSPPDPNLVQQAVDLAVNLPGLPPLPQ